MTWKKYTLFLFFIFGIIATPMVFAGRDFRTVTSQKNFNIFEETNGSINFITPSIVEVVFDGDVNLDNAMNVNSWIITSSSFDDQYSTGIHPSKIERFSSILNADDRDLNGQTEDDRVFRHQIYLYLPISLELDTSCTIIGNNVEYQPFVYPNNGGGTDGDYLNETQTSIYKTLVFGGPQGRSKSIKINQSGYNPNSDERYAYAGYWLGSGGVLSLSESSFTVYRAADGQQVSSGIMNYLGQDSDSEEYVMEMDISSLSVGDYYIETSDLGRSNTFSVGGHSFLNLYTVARGLYHQRSGTSLTSSYTDWTHDTCHLTVYETDVLEDWGDTFPEDTAQTNPITLEGGWYDAGDFDRRPLHFDTVEHLLISQEIFSDSLPDDFLDIPESGNGIPDLLDEAMFGLKLWEQLQEESGGVRAGVESYRHPSGSTCEGDTIPYWTYAVNRYASYRFASAASNIGRMLREDYGNVTRGNELVQAAMDAYTWAEVQSEYGTTSPVVRTEEQKADDIARVRLAASGGLFAATGNTAYQDDFVEEWTDLRGPTHYNTIYSLWGMAVSEQMFTNSELQDDVRLRISQSADQFVGYLEDGDLYRSSFRANDYIGSGTATTVTRYVLPIIMGYHFDPQQQYIDAVSLNVDYQLGANANGISWITGLGYRNAPYPLQLNSMYDDIRNPVPGIPIYGPAPKEYVGGVCSPTNYWQCLVYNGFYPNMNSVPDMYQFTPWAGMAGMNEFTVWQDQGYTTAAMVFQYVTSQEVDMDVSVFGASDYPLNPSNLP